MTTRRPEQKVSKLPKPDDRTFTVTMTLANYHRAHNALLELDGLMVPPDSADERGLAIRQLVYEVMEALGYDEGADAHLLDEKLSRFPFNQLPKD